MKKILLLLMMVASVASAKPEKPVDEWTFFSGAHLGMTMTEFIDYYGPLSDTWVGHSGAPEGQSIVDFRSYGTDGTDGTDEHDWRVLVTYRESDEVIVSIEYSNDGKFPKGMIDHLKELNKNYPGLITRLYDDGSGAEFVATTAAQDKLESAAN